MSTCYTLTEDEYNGLAAAMSQLDLMTNVLEAVGHLRQALLAVYQLNDRETLHFLTGLVGQVSREVRAIQSELNLPEWTGDDTPEWVLWERVQKAESNGQGSKEQQLSQSDGLSDVAAVVARASDKAPA